MTKNSTTTQATGTSGLAVAGLVLGILALFGAFVPLFNILTLPFAVLGLVLAAVGLAGVSKGKKTGKGIAIAGIVLGALALVVTFGMYGAAGAASDSSSSAAVASASSAASSEDDGSGEEAAEPAAPTLGSTVTFDGLEIAFASEYTTTTLSNQFSDHDGATVIEVPITVTNVSDEKNMLNIFYLKTFGPSGNELDNISAYFSENDASLAGEMRPGATAQTVIHILYEGDGEYIIDLRNFSEEVEVSFPVQLQ